tara:strand:+ start:957 stop:1769 length:813 start_codon:yes stop_codon:yes gene_type:complete
MSLIRSGALALVLAFTCGVTTQAQQIDLSKMVQAPPSMPLGEGVKVGYRVETQVKSGPTTMSSFTAVVGETEDAWEVESNQMTQAYGSMPGGEGLLMALVLDKKTFKVLSAKIGVPGGELKEVKVMELKQHPQAKTPPSKEEEFTLPSGKKVKVSVTTSQAGGQTYTSWVGAKGTDLEGLLLGLKGPSANRTLSADPAEVDHELQDKDAEGKARTVVGQEVVYTDGSRFVMTKDPVAKSLHYGMLSNTTPTSKIEVVSLRTDAKPTLTWN